MINEDFIEKKNCRICRSTNLTLILDLGNTPLADEFSKEDHSNNMQKLYPLALNSCMDCGWLQTSIVVHPKILYQNDYPYDSSVTTTGRNHWAELAKSAHDILIKGINKRSLDIGANVGVLVNEFNLLGFDAVGVDPSQTAAEIAKQKGIEVHNDFFNIEFIEKYVKTETRFSVVTATNVFAHIDNLDEWMDCVKKILIEDGVLIIEVPHALNLIRELEFDTIYHEHLSYVSLRPLIKFFSNQGFNIFKIETRNIHGGTLRIYASPSNLYEKDGTVDELIKHEIDFGLFDISRLKFFSESVSNLISEFQLFIKNIFEDGKTLVAISAPAKGMTFLNVVGLRSPILKGISDRAKQKLNRFAPGTGLRVVEDSDLPALNPDYVIILAWNFKHEIVSNVRQLFKSNTKFLVAIPKIEEV